MRKKEITWKIYWAENGNCNLVKLLERDFYFKKIKEILCEEEENTSKYNFLNKKN